MIRESEKEKKQPKEEIEGEDLKYWFKVANRWWKALEERDYLVLRYKNMDEDEVHNVKVEWAKELERVERLDKVPRQKIVNILAWLLDINDFWVTQGGPLQSLSQLRTSKKGKRKLDTIVGQYDAWLSKRGGGTVSNKPQKGEKFTQYQYDKLVEAYPQLVDKIKRMPVNEAKQEYMYVGE